MGELRYLPVKPRSKLPRDKGWEKNNYTHDDLDGFNVGMIIDQTMIDVDLDWPEARAVVQTMDLHNTTSWGRKGEISTSYIAVNCRSRSTSNCHEFRAHLN